MKKESSKQIGLRNLHLDEKERESASTKENKRLLVLLAVGRRTKEGKSSSHVKKKIEQEPS